MSTETPMAGCHTCNEPLVLTFEFAGKEFICVVCGQLYEYFGPKHLEWTPELQARHDELAAQYDTERKERARLEREAKR